MTLVGCLTSNESPILLGDLLLSDGKTGDPAGIRKKIRRLGSTIAIGWAGNLVGADTVVSELERNLNDGAGKQDVEGALLAIDPRDSPGSLTLVGWVVDGEDADAFHWQSSNHELVNWGGPWYVGSGGRLMNDLLPGGETLPGDEGRDPRLAVLEVVAYFMADETFYGAYAPIGIGHAYEVMWWNGTAFEYIEPVRYFATQATFDANGKFLMHEQAGRHVKYFTRDELTVVIRYEGKSRLTSICTPIGQPIPGKTDRSACLALGKELVESKGWFGPDTQFYGILFDLKAPGYKGKGGVSVLPRGFENGSIKVIESETGIKLGLTGHALRQIFEAIKKGEGWPTVFRFW